MIKKEKFKMVQENRAEMGEKTIKKTKNGGFYEKCIKMKKQNGRC